MKTITKRYHLSIKHCNCLFFLNIWNLSPNGLTISKNMNVLSRKDWPNFVLLVNVIVLITKDIERFDDQW